MKAPKQVKQAGMNIIIVEDEIIVAMDLEFKLQAMGYNVVDIVDNYSAAIQQANQKKIDLALLDINIVGEKTGIDVAKYFKETFNIPCIFLTAFSNNAIIEEVKKVGAYGYVLKPYSGKELKLVIEIAENKFKKDLEVIENNKLLKTQVHDRQAELEKVNIKLREEIEYRKKLEKNIKDSQNRERKRIAKELHDGLSQNLTAIKFTIEAISNKIGNSNEFHPVLCELVEMVQSSVREVREISHQLTPSYIKESGLTLTLKNTCDRLNDLGLFTIITDFDNEFPRLDQEKEIALFRVAQESINNSIKHSKGNQIKVGLAQDDQEIVMSIEDNGQGINQKKLIISNGIGMNNIRERCESIDATLEVKSAQPTGTRISVKLKK